MTDFWNKRYSESDFAYGEEPNEYFLQKIDALQPGKLLLPAEGEGRNAVYAALRGWDVTAVDASSEGKVKALMLAAKKSVTLNYVVSPLEEFAFPENAFDAAALIFAHFNPQLRSRVHDSVIKSLKSGGHLIMEVFSKEQISYSSGGPKDPEMLNSIENIKNDFKQLSILELNEVSTILNEGKYHSGEAKVIRFFGVKI